MSQCLVVKKEILEKTDFWSRIPHNSEGKLFGFVKLKPREVNEFLKIVEENKEFKERYGESGIEDKPEWQQIIFYGLIRQGERFFVYQRGGEKSQYKEKRLQSKISVGIGGHIEPFDNTLIDPLYRELDEEMIFRKNSQEINLKNRKGEINKESFLPLLNIKIVGLIKNELTEVDEVHLGLACEVNLLDPALMVEVREEENVEGKMMSLKEYQDWIGQGKVIPEFWTQILIGEISKDLKPRKGKERI